MEKDTLFLMIYRNNYKEFIKTQKNYNEFNCDGLSMLTVAAQYGRLKIIKHLCQNITIDAINALDESPYGTALSAACLGGHYLIVSHLLKMGANPNIYKEERAIDLACYAGNISIVKALVKYGANIKNDDKKLGEGFSFVKAALSLEQKNSKKIIEYLLKTFPAGLQALNQDNEGVIHLTWHHGWGVKAGDGIKLLTGLGANINMQDNNRKTILHHMSERAKSKQDFDIIEEMVNIGANPLIADKNGCTAIDILSGNKPPSYITIEKNMYEAIGAYNMLSTNKNGEKEIKRI